MVWVAVWVTVSISPTPFSPPSGLATGSFNGLHPKSKFLHFMAKADIGSLEAFKAKVKSCDLRMEGPVLHYQTVYGDKMTFDSSYQAIPTING